MKRLCGFLPLVFLFGSAVAHTHFRMRGASENEVAEIAVTCKKDEYEGPCKGLLKVLEFEGTMATSGNYVDVTARMLVNGK